MFFNRLFYFSVICGQWAHHFSSSHIIQIKWAKKRIEYKYFIILSANGYYRSILQDVLTKNWVPCSGTSFDCSDHTSYSIGLSILLSFSSRISSSVGSLLFSSIFIRMPSIRESTSDKISAHSFNCSAISGLSATRCLYLS